MYSNYKAWIPVIGVVFANLEIFLTPWFYYQIISILAFSILVIKVFTS